MEELDHYITSLAEGRLMGNITNISQSANKTRHTQNTTMNSLHKPCNREMSPHLHSEHYKATDQIRITGPQQKQPQARTNNQYPLATTTSHKDNLHEHYKPLMT